MSKFVSSRDYKYMKSINSELINDVIETSVILFAVDANFTRSNMYNESMGKVFKPGITTNALILHEDQTTTTEEFANITQNIIVAWSRIHLQDLDFYPENGDYLRYNNAYYELTQIVDNQFVAGNTEFPNSIVGNASLINVSVLNIRYE